MTPEEARNLVADALESDRFKQGQRALERDGRNCCLGVACRVYMENGGELNISVGDDRGTSFDGQRGYLPEKVQQWLGFRDRKGGFSDKHCQTALTTKNDTGMPFHKIAKLFRNPPEGLLNEQNA